MEAAAVASCRGTALSSSSWSFSLSTLRNPSLLRTRRTSRPTPTQCTLSNGMPSAASAAAECPFHQRSSQGFQPADVKRVDKSSSKQQTAGPPIPGPASAWQNILDVRDIVGLGLHEAILAFEKRYGPVCRFTSGKAGWTFIMQPEAVQWVAITNSQNYQHRYLPDIYNFVFHDKGILGSQGEYNRRHRKMCQPPFLNALQLQRFAQSIVDSAARMSNIWQTLPPFETDVSVQMQRLTLDVVGQVAFSHDFGQIDRMHRELVGVVERADAERDKLLNAINLTQSIMGRVFITPLPLLKFMKLVGEPNLKALDKAFAEIREVMMGVVGERRAARDAGVKANSSDLLEVLLGAKDDNGVGLTDEELWEDVHDVMGAGHDTTASTMSACIYCIAQNPQVEAKVVEELRSVLGGRLPSYEDVPHLPYLQQVLKETLRLFPPIPLMPRVARDADTLPSGHTLPAGDVVFMSCYAMGRSPSIWVEPELFDPERFSPENEAKRHKYAWLPFGAGPRMCLGASFAMMSTTLVLATLLQRFKFTAIDPSGTTPKTLYDIVMYFPEGLRMKVMRREEAREERRDNADKKESTLICA
eukprot:jgi/Chlat1/5219/Chrsp33S05189